MRNVAIVLIFFLASSFTAQSQISSVLDGTFHDPSTWDCGCVPTSVDDIVVTTVVTASIGHVVNNATINSGAILKSNSNAFTVLGDLLINVGGKLRQTALFEVRGNYILWGKHSGSNDLRLQTGGTLYGNGVFIKTGTVTIVSGDYYIDPSAELDISTSNINLQNSSRIFNDGEITVHKIIGNVLSTWSNRSGATLRVNQSINRSMLFRAHFTGNTVVYQRTGATTQLLIPAESGYYDLELVGSSLSSLRKMTDNIVILNDLTLESCSLDPLDGGTVYNLIIGGSWNNISGDFVKRTSKVTFNGIGGLLTTHHPRVSLYDAEFSGNSTLMDKLEVTNTMNLTGLLNANGNNIHSSGKWQHFGDLVSNGAEVIFRGNLTAEVTGLAILDDVRISKTSGGIVDVLGTMRVFGSLHLDFGILRTNNNVVIASNSVKTGRLAKVLSGTLDGDLTVERYMNFPTNDWHLIGSSIGSTTLNDWSGDFITTGYPGSDYPDYWFTNVTRYDETVAGHKDIGFFDVGSSAEAVQDGEGRRAYIASGTNRLSVTGTPHIGPFSWNISYTNTGDAPNDGWNLISNPYPSSIDWDDSGSWAKFGVKNAIYVWGGQDGTYTSYVGGIGTNGGTQYIPSSQGFWVQTDLPLPTLSIIEDAKAEDDEVFRTAASQYFKLKMTTANGLSDELAVRAHQNATFEFDRDWDAYEFKSADQNYPSISLTTTDNEDLSIYSLPIFDESTMIPMPVYAGVAGDVNFTLQGGEDFPAKQVRLFDMLENKYYRLVQNRAVSIYLDEGDYENRFFLVLDPLYINETTDVRSISNVDTDIDAWVNDGQITIRNTRMEDQLVNITILNSLGQLVYQESASSLTETKLIDVHHLNGLLILQIDNLEDGTRFIERLVK